MGRERTSNPRRLPHEWTARRVVAVAQVEIQLQHETRALGIIDRNIPRPAFRANLERGGVPFDEDATRLTALEGHGGRQEAFTFAVWGLSGEEAVNRLVPPQ